MRALVTGGAGFLGSHLCEHLLQQGHTVICLDNFYTGSKENVAHLLANPAFSLVDHDITQPIDIACDRIYNLACPASPIHYQKDPIKTLFTSLDGTRNMLELARKNKARLLQASTSEVYGDPLEHPQKETYWGNVNPIGVRSCYDEGKRVAETLCTDYRRKHGVEVRIVRIFNTYGPRMAVDDGRIVSNFLVQALRGEPLTVYGDGTQTRSFQYVQDLIEGMHQLMESDVEGPVNMGNPEEFTVLGFAQKVLALTGSGAGIVHKELPSDDPTRRKPDITRAKETLGWQPKVTIDEGLAKTLPYFTQKVGQKRQHP